MKIITLTLNPAYDLHLYTDSLRPGRDNSARLLRRDAGGKGINLSRALAAYGLSSTAYLLVGRESAVEYLAALHGEGIRPLYDTTSGYVRENINIHTGEGDTVITTEGTPITAAELAGVKERILPLLDSDSYLVFSGGIPSGSERAPIFSLLSEAGAHGARLILDSRSLTVEEIFGLSPYLIKPNLGEAEALLGEPISGIEGAILASQALYQRASGRVENILLTAGKEGAVLASLSGVYKATTPEIRALSTVGAGDSAIAGFLAAEAEGLSDSDKLRLATAFGSAACLEEGTRPPRAEKITELYPEVRIEKIIN